MEYIIGGLLFIVVALLISVNENLKAIGRRSGEVESHLFFIKYFLDAEHIRKRDGE